MGDKNLVICDREFRYASNLMENIAERRELAIKSYACTTWEKVISFSQEKTIDILVVDERYPVTQRKEAKAVQVFVLTTGVCGDLQQEEKSIYKYQCADQILAEIFEAYFEKTNEGIFKKAKKDELKILAVYSPIHRAGKTTFAIAFGKELAKRAKVLYLNLEAYSGFGGVFQREEKGSLEDILYYAKQEEGNLGMRISMSVKKMDELDYLSPIPVCSDLKEVVLEEWQHLFEQIAENTMYEMVLLDLCESVQGLFQILRLSDRIYMPVLKNRISQEKLTQYEENLDKLGLEDIRNKTLQFIVPKQTDECVKRLIKEERV